MTKTRNIISPIVGEFPIIKFNDNGDVIYFEGYDGTWAKHEFDDNGNETYYETSTGYWAKHEFDEFDRCTRYENSKIGWCQLSLDEDDMITSYEDNDGNYWTKEMGMENPYKYIMYDIILATS